MSTHNTQFGKIAALAAELKALIAKRNQISGGINELETDLHRLKWELQTTELRLGDARLAVMRAVIGEDAE